MNRDIEFMGKNPDDGEWYFGYLVKMKNGQTEICTNEVDNVICRINVIPETVGQYTGLKDKNGVKIFEGDILCYYSGNPFDPDIDIYPIVYKNGSFKFGDEYLDVILDDPSGFEVIGNIHDNPELLEANDD